MIRDLWNIVYHQFVNCEHPACPSCDGRRVVQTEHGMWRACVTCGGKGVICFRGKCDHEWQERGFGFDLYQECWLCGGSDERIGRRGKP